MPKQLHREHPSRLVVFELFTDTDALHVLIRLRNRRGSEGTEPRRTRGLQ